MEFSILRDTNGSQEKSINELLDKVWPQLKDVQAPSCYTVGKRIITSLRKEKERSHQQVLKAEKSNELLLPLKRGLTTWRGDWWRMISAWGFSHFHDRSTLIFFCPLRDEMGGRLICLFYRAAHSTSWLRQIKSTATPHSSYGWDFGSLREIRAENLAISSLPNCLCVTIRV
jgi:hypothetical protein